MAEIIYGVNPVRELIRAGQAVEKVFLSKHKGPAAALAMKLRDAGVPVIDCDDKRLDSMCAAEDGTAGNHQGIAAVVAAAEYASVDDILAFARQSGQDAFIILLNGITDPHNFGAIIRSAEALGAHGVIIPTRRSTGLTATAFRASSGAAAHMRIARVSNLSATAEQLKQHGLWICGADAGEQDCFDANLTGPLALCIGAEGEGLSRLMRERCDFLVGIPLTGQTESLNASCAASILLYETARQRRAK